MPKTPDKLCWTEEQYTTRTLGEENAVLMEDEEDVVNERPLFEIEITARGRECDCYPYMRARELQFDCGLLNYLRMRRKPASTPFPSLQSDIGLDEQQQDFVDKQASRITSSSDN